MNIETTDPAALALRAARSAQVFGAPEAEALQIYEAYQALRAQDVARAASLAQDLTQRLPANPHPWQILGMIALDRLEGQTAETFFREALRVAPGAADALSGVGKALVLQNDPFGGVEFLGKAIEGGSEDLSMIGLYKDLMLEMDRGDEAVEVLEPAARRMEEVPLYLTIGNICSGIERYDRAIACFEAAYALAPDQLETRSARVRAYQFRQDYAKVAELAGELIAEHPELEEMTYLRIGALKKLGRYDEAMALFERPFQHAVFYQRALGMIGQMEIDRGNYEAARKLLRTAYFLTDQDGTWGGKVYGTFCLSLGRYTEGAPAYAGRVEPKDRRRAPYENSAPEALAGRKRLFLIGEQGVGDHFAFLPLIRLAPLAEDAEVVLLAGPRLGPALEGNTLGISHRSQADFDPKAVGLMSDELVYMADLVRYLSDPLPGFGGYLSADPGRVAALRARYRALSEGRPVTGVAWRSGNHLNGKGRSVALSELVARLPEGSFVVNLQYRATKEEIAEAAALRPDLTLFSDPEVDHVADLSAMLAQVAAMDRVVTIDNTTAHACGALGHEDAHVLLPRGADCMWFWRREPTLDPWYGCLHLHRQAVVGDWVRPLEEIGALPPPVLRAGG
ncbi:tetratricopeptide repeat protein [Solirhodobacter olei]|uniref:tetratricopeptide repeat protein n=1 Tax=Solirhodobacter olei TaxID=2493082 RepID=UPI000FD79BFE|nr:tetratricopeptide repeat protein [Solirhodobacter olei]